MAINLFDDSWKGDVELQEKLKQYVKEALKREEILSFLRRDFSQYQWSIRTLDRRLSYIVRNIKSGNMSQSSEVLIREMNVETYSEICQLLDVKQFVKKNDARMLAAKIGMTNNEIKMIFDGLGSGDQKSPTEQILASWGTKNEATVGRLREILKDMDREDVISVLDKKYPPDENATCVPVQVLERLGSEDTVDSSPAQVFISYQWDSQTEAQKLKEILEKNKLSCWMDVHRLYGGDELHPKITKAINDAKVMISIVTKKYLDSINCQREVSLALTKNPATPVIPIHLEKVDTSSSKLGTLFAPIVYVSCYEGLSDDKLQEIVESVCNNL